MKKLKICTALLAALFLLLPAADVRAEGYGEGENGSPVIQDKPDWYPDDPKNFRFFHDETAPRVVDDADIFTSAEEDEMEGLIRDIIKESGKDVVVFTDVSAHGLERSVYCADFYDFNGYGYGDEREGLCLFVCMDPDNRGFWTCGTGSSTRALQTEYNAYLLDSTLREFMSEGNYGDGVIDWIKNVGTLYQKGHPFAPEWFPDYGKPIERFHDPDAPRVVDTLGMFSADELSELTAEALDISKTYDMDVVILTADVPISLISDFDRNYYELNGYGFGDDYSGVMLTLTPRGGFTGVTLTFEGTAYDHATYLLRDRLYRNIGYYSYNDRNYEAAGRYLRDVRHLLKTGRVEMLTVDWLKGFGLMILIGAAFGGVALAIAAIGMRVPKVRKNANGYLVKDSFASAAVMDDLVGTKTVRTYRPPERSSSSSSGGSSYSSSYSGSSGASHSGSGMDF